MSKEEFKQIFFELLTEDEDFKQKLTEFIINAVAEKFVERVAQIEEPPKAEEVAPAVEQGSYSKEFVEKVIEQTDFEKVCEEKESAEKQRDEFKQKSETLQQEKESAESQRDEFKRKAETLQQEKESVEKQRDALEQQLAERFADGWEIYQKFLSIDESARENSGLRTENFETFICSGAQMKRLEGIWEAALDCKRYGKIADAEIIWNVFAYCVRLVNAAQGDKIIEILDTQIGERYDTDKHSTSMTNSSTQGVVREIILAGYKNNNSRKIVRKSNVRVG